jgi:uncharacterized lipoprotein YddW (UPF0748 family)
MLLFTLLLTFNLDFRGIWVPRWSIDDHPQILAKLDGQFNHVFLQIFALGEAYYPSRYATTKRKDDTWLREFLEEAHQRNIEVSAWVNVLYSWGYAPKTRHQRHPINRNPNWYVQEKPEKSILGLGVEELRRQSIEGYYLAPASLQVREYIHDIVDEILENYDFDGVHLDYIRYPSHRFIYDVALRSKFMRAYCLDPSDLALPTIQERLSVWGNDDLDNLWRQFVRDDLTSFIRDFVQHVKKKRPQTKISVAVKADYRTAQTEFFQDWPQWVNNDLVDFVCLMAYRKNIETVLNRTLEKIIDPRKVTVGLGIYTLSVDRIRAQVQQVAAMPFSGVVFFSYEELRKNQEYLDAFFW